MKRLGNTKKINSLYSMRLVQGQASKCKKHS
jgi:hypothetical protein